jgi:hypothetical protein
MKNRDNLPDPLFMQKLQEFCIEQGVVGSRTEPILSPVLEFLGNGAHIGPGLRALSTLKKGGHGRVVSGAVSVVRDMMGMPEFFYFWPGKIFRKNL